MSPGHPRVGVVVLNYLGVDDTLACLESLAALDDPVRVIVVDNGSADGSAARLAAVPDVELVTSESNLGFAGGNNVAIARLLDDGLEFVWVLNNDTLVEPATVRELLAVADADPRIGAVGSVLYDMAAPQNVLTWGGGRLGRWTGRTRDARAESERVDYLTAASVLLTAQQPLSANSCRPTRDGKDRVATVNGCPSGYVMRGACCESMSAMTQSSTTAKGMVASLGTCVAKK